MVSLNLLKYSLILTIILPSLTTCFQQNWWNGLRNGSSNQKQPQPQVASRHQSWTSPLPTTRELPDNWSSVTASVVTSSPLVARSVGYTPHTASSAPFMSSWTPVITSSFNSMQSVGPLSSPNSLQETTQSVPAALRSNGSRVNESLVDSSSTLRRSASRYADEFDSLISSKTFAPIIRATSKELIREKEIYFDHENYNDGNGNDQRDNVAWDDRIEFPPSTTTTLTLNLPEATSKPLKDEKSSDQVSSVDHNVNGATSSSWFKSSSSAAASPGKVKADKLQRKSKSNLVKKSGRRLDALVSTEASPPSTTTAQPQFVDSLDLKAAYEKEISEIQSGAISGEKYEDLSDSFKLQPRAVVKSSPPSERLVKFKGTPDTTTNNNNNFVKKTSPLVELLTTLQPPPTSGRLRQSKASLQLDGVKGGSGGKVVKSEKQKLVNGQVTSYFNWGKSESPATTTSGQVTTTPINLPDDNVEGRVENLQLANKKSNSARQTIGNRKGQVKVSKKLPLQATKSTKLTLPSRLNSNNNNDQAPSEEAKEEGDVDFTDAVTFAPISSTPSLESTRLRLNSKTTSSQGLWSAGRTTSKLVDSVGDLKRLNPPTTTSNRLSRISSSTLSTRDVYDTQTVTTPSSRPSSTLPVTVASVPSTTQSSSLRNAFDSAFKAAVTDDKSTVDHTTDNKNRKQQKQKQVSRVKGALNKAKVKSQAKAAPILGGKSSFTVETSDFGWSTDINHNGDGNSEVKLLTRKSGIINPSFQSERLIDDEVDDIDEESTTTLSPITTTVPSTTTTRLASTSKSTTRVRPTGGITRNPTRRPSSTTTGRPSSTTTAGVSTPGGSFVTFTEDEESPRTTGTSARQQGEVKGSRSTRRPERLEVSTDSTGQLDDLTDSKLTKKSGIQYNNLQQNPFDRLVEREEGEGASLSGEQGDRSVESSDKSDEEDCRLEDAIPGTPLTDYPTYASMPVTSFKCSDVEYPGYYGDMEAQCQVFHVCQTDGRKNDFLCPIGTIFNQELLVCDWWQNFRCADTPNYYSANANLYLTANGPSSVNVNVNNQLRKRTDAIEREGDDDNINGTNNDDVLSEEVDNEDYDSSRERSNIDSDAPTAVSSPPGPISEVVVSSAVKGGRSTLTRYTQSVEQLTLTKPRATSSKKQARVSAGYGARLISLDTLDSVALPSNIRARVTESANTTSPSTEAPRAPTNESTVTLPSVSSASPSSQSSSSSTTPSSSSSSVTSSPSQYKATSQYVSPLEGITSSSSSLFSP